MKIGFDIRVLMDKQYSGVANFTFHLLNHLLNLDKDNSYKLFCNSFSKLNDNILRLDNVVRTKYPNKIFNYLMQKHLHYPKIDKILGSVDLMYLPHLNFASISRTTKKIITVHDISFIIYPEFFSLRKNIWHKSLDVLNNLKHFDKIVAVSENTKNDIVKYLHIDENKIEVVYPGLDQIDLNLNINYEYLKNKYGFDLRQKYILYLGTIEPRKNIASLIRAYNILRDRGFDYKLVLAGSWGWKTEDIKREWNLSVYKEDIIFTNYLAYNDKSAFYKKASLFVYPSFYEGFGFPPLEAMMHQIPVIAGNTSSLPEVLSDSALLINPDKSFEIYEAMSLVLSNEKLRESLVKSANNNLSLFSWEKTASSYMKIFNSI